MRRFRTHLLPVFLFLSAVGGARAQSQKLSADLQQILGQTLTPTNVIIQFKSAPSLLDLVALQLVGGVINRTYSVIPALAVTLPAPQILGLLSLPNLLYITPDRTLQPLLDISAPAVNAPSAWQSGLDGSGIGVAVIDSGIASHPDLNTANGSASRVVYHQSFVDSATGDPYGHGTHVAGIIGGNAHNSLGTSQVYRGIAPNATLVDLRVLDKNGASQDSIVIAAIDRAIQLKSKYNIRVINLSLGRPIFESYTVDPLCQAVTAAWKQGIVVVVSAGNLGRNGYMTILAPANTPSVITVGAMKTMGTITRSDDLIASYSSRGPSYLDLVAKPDLVAPGNLWDPLESTCRHASLSIL